MMVPPQALLSEPLVILADDPACASEFVSSIVSRPSSLSLPRQLLMKNIGRLDSTRALWWVLSPLLDHAVR